MSFEHPHLHPGTAGTRTLRTRLAEEGALSEGAALRLARELAEGLSWLHAAGRRHGRLTPDAVFFDAQGRAVLALDAPEPDGDRGWVPFELGAGKATPASDLYQLGATVLFAVTGREPVSSGLPLAFRAPPELAALSAPARELVDWLVEPRWDRRPPDAASVARDAAGAAQGRPNARRARRTRTRALVASGVSFVVLAAGLALWPAKPPRVVHQQTVRPPIEAPRPPAAPAETTTPAATVYPDVMGVQRAADGAVWVFTKYQVHRFPAGRPEDGRAYFHELVAETKRLLAKSREPTYLSYAVGFAAPDDRVFAGTWKGEVEGVNMRTRQAMAIPVLGDAGRVDALAERSGTVYAAHRGRLYSWLEGSASWRPESIPYNARVDALCLTRSGSLYAAGARGLWREERGSWKPVWSGTGLRATYLGEDLFGNLLVGSPDGLTVVSPSGEVTGRHLPGVQVTAAAVGADGRLWVGAWDGGLRLLEGGEWRRLYQGLPDDDVLGLAVDSSGLLWVGLYGKGLVTLPETEAAARAAR